MQIRHMTIQNFRGIRHLDWHVTGEMICLVGPGDSTKTTILDAIEYALNPKWNILLSDTDFYDADTESNIVIQVSVSGIPESLTTDDKFGLYLRGYKEGHTIVEDPEDGCIPILTIQLNVSDDLEPHWYIIKESNPEPKRISWREREKLGMARLGEYYNRHFTWGRGSALSKITDQNVSPFSAICSANRAACQAVEDAPLDELKVSAGIVQKAATDFGVKIDSLRPGLDSKAVSFGAGTISLHENKIPLRSFGLGTKRLTSLAIQQSGIGSNGIVLIDEIEHGLEPHRIRQLIKIICDKILLKTRDGKPVEPDQGQVFTTTHSPTPIMALPVIALRFVSSDNGVTTIKEVAPESQSSLQSVVRSQGHALLARKIIICEGKTEEALCRVLDGMWALKHNDQNFPYHGVVAINGQGRNSGPSCARDLKRIGYDVLFFGDSDEPISPDSTELKSEGIEVILWPDNMSTEERIAADIPISNLNKFLCAAVDEYDETSVLDAVGSRLGKNVTQYGTAINLWIDNGLSESEIRAAIGKTAKKHLKGWFKDLNRGERLGKIVTDVLDEIPDKPLTKSIKRIESWIYGEPSS